MALTIKDSSAVVRSLKTTLDGSDHVSHHHIDSIAAGTNAIGKLAANTGVDIGDVDVTSVVPGVAATNLGKAEDAAHSSGDVGVMVLAVRTDTAAARATTDGDYIPLITDSAGRLHVNVGALPASTNTVEVVGDAAHDAAVSGNPVRVGGRAVNVDLAEMSNDDAADIVTDLTGKLVTSPHAAYSNFVSGATGDITDTTATQVIAAQAAGYRIYVTSLLVTNGDTTTSTFVNITDGSGGTVLWTGYAVAGGGGFACTFPTPIKTTAATALYCVCVTTGATVRVCAAGYRGR